jgi:uncharacterized membrane protein
MARDILTTFGLAVVLTVFAFLAFAHHIAVTEQVAECRQGAAWSTGGRMDICGIER